MDFRCNRTWEYYTALAENMGTDSTGCETAFSFAWIYRYYSDNRYQLNELVKVFLGYEEINAVHLGIVPAININDYLVEPGPNPDQAAAIEMSLREPVTFIQGPPGTGKSRTILNLMSCIVNGLNATVLMASANNAAVEVISEKIEEYNNAGVHGNGSHTDQNRQNLYDTFARLGNQKMVKKFNETHDDYTFRYRKNNQLGVSVVHNVSFADFSQDYKAIISTLHSMKKLFNEGPNLQYDYIIIDESSQVNPLLGLIALSSARHIIIVGDEEQLPPIIKTERFERITDEYGIDVPDNLLICDDAYGKAPSFLDMCLRRFLKNGESNKVFLREHYRCHPAIIEFCNRNVYDNRLRVLTGTVDTSDIKVPIKVLWYQGDYCERVYLNEDNTGDTSKRNGKQVEIFVREELPVLIRRMQSPETNTMDSFSILSPFRGVLQELGNRISEYLCDRNLLDDINVSVNGHSTSAMDDDDNEIPILSVFKSQGREYDVVYLLPGEDANWDRPWSQGRNLINVAVSRAKEELRIICSTTLMSEPMQRALLGCEEVIPDSQRRTENFRYVQKLIDYIKIANDSRSEYILSRNEWDPQGIYDDLNLQGIEFDFPVSRMTEPTGFGFHRTGIRSVFDAAPCIRRDAEEIRNDNESFLQCVIHAIAGINRFRVEKLDMYTDIMLTDITDSIGQKIIMPEMVRDVLSEVSYEATTGAAVWDGQLDLHMDLVITDNNHKILLMIEVDGGYHRFNIDPEQLDSQKKRDEAKKLICDRFLGGIPFLRLPADGTGTGETSIIEDILNSTPTQTAFCMSRCITAIDRENAHDLKLRFIADGLLTERHMWHMESDGLSWKMVMSEKMSVVPTLRGEAAGIVRHYSLDRNNQLYVNPEYLDRFVDRYINQ